MKQFFDFMREESKCHSVSLVNNPFRIVNAKSHLKERVQRAYDQCKKEEYNFFQFDHNTVFLKSAYSRKVHDALDTMQVYTIHNTESMEEPFSDYCTRCALLLKSRKWKYVTEIIQCLSFVPRVRSLQTHD